MAQAEGAPSINNEEMRQIRELLNMQPLLLARVQELEKSLVERDARIAELEIVDKEKEILLKMQAEEKTAKIVLRKFHDKYYHSTTWEPQFDDVVKMATRHVTQFMSQMNAPEESIQRNKESLEKCLNDFKERTRIRQKELKASTMQQLQNKMAGDFWVLRVEEKHGKARAEIMTDELYKDEDINALLKDLEKKCKRRRWGIILGTSTVPGFLAGHAVGIGLGVAGVCATGPAALVGLGAGVVVGLAFVGGMVIYAFWPEIKEFSSNRKDKLKEKFAIGRKYQNLEEVLEEVEETLMVDQPQADNAVFI